MAEFVLGRIKFVYQGNWTTGESYLVDDVVTNGGKTYICIKNHTASALFADDYDTNANVSSWAIVADGQSWQGDWIAGAYYNIGDLVKYGGIVYECNTPHTAATYVSPTWLGLENDIENWDVFSTSFSWKGAWATSTRYKAYDVVSYGGITYVCNAPHISNASSSSGLEANSGNWDTFNAGIKYLGAWSSSSIRYRLNDVVKYGADLWICTTQHTSSASFDNSKWNIFVNGFQFENSWAGGTTYQIGDIVTYGGYSYVCKQNHSTTQTPSTASSYWDVYTTGFSFQGDWVNSTSYLVGSVVRNHGYTYLSVLDSPSITTSSTGTVASTDLGAPNTILADTTGVVAGMSVVFGTSFGGLVAGKIYYVLSSGLTSTAFKVSLTLNGTAEALTTTTGQTVSTVVSAQTENVSYWTRLNSGIQWSNNSQTYTTVSTTNVTVTNGLASGAVYTVVRTGTVYNLTRTSNGSNYTTGDIVKILGSNVGGLSPVNDITITVTASSGAITGQTYSGISSTWSSSTVYVLGDVVFFGANSYICIQSHTSASGNRPDNDTSATYWNLLTAGAEAATLTTAGDTLFYGPNGPSRLPIGTDGQILRVTNGYPAWKNYGLIQNLVYVGPTGVDLPYPQAGFSIDRPWASIRYACQQVENGYLNPQAQLLLKKNKQFIIKEVNNYLIYTYKVSTTGTSAGTFTTSDTSGLSVNMPICFANTNGGVTVGTTYYVKAITAGTGFTISTTPGGNAVALSGSGTNTGNFYYDQTKTERDAGIVLDAVVFDIGHGGTWKTTDAVKAYYTSNGRTYITNNVGYELTEFIAALNYLSTMIGKVLSNTAPSSNYQTLNSVGTPSTQIIDSTLTAESGTITSAQLLVSIITNGLAAGTTFDVPAAIYPDTTISVKTGTYNEILPINVPAYTCILGDELRSTVVQPMAADPLLATVIPKTVDGFNYIKSLIPNLISNNSITPTTGNTTAQVTSLPAGSIGSTVAVSRLQSSFTTLYSLVANGLGGEPAIVRPSPTNWGTSLTNVAYTTTGNATGSTSGYSNAVVQIQQNYPFIVAEVLQYLINNYPAIYTAEGTAGPANGYRDVAYILDSILYDLTYGGNTQSLVAGSSYYSFYSRNILSTEVTPFVNALGRLKTIITTIAQKSAVTALANNLITQNTSGTGGSANAGSFAQDRVQDVIDWINNGYGNTSVAPYTGWATSTLQTAYSDLTSKVSNIQSDTTVWCQKYYQGVSFDLALTSRDAGLVINSLAYDMVFGTNFNAIQAGRAYCRGTTSATRLRNGSQLAPTLGAINFMYYKAKQIAASGATVQIQTTIDDITGYLTGGKLPSSITWSVPSLPLTSYTSVTGTVLSGGGNGSAAFTIVRSSNGNGYYNYVVTPTTAGASYTTSSKIKILGTSIGGTTPANDIVLNVTQVTSGGVVAVTYSDTSATVGLLESNRAFLLAEVIAYINANYSSITTNPNYSVAKTQRDTSLLLDAIHYDITYGGNWQSQEAGTAYYSALYGTQITSGFSTAFIAAISYISTLAQSVVQGTLVASPLQGSVIQALPTASQTVGSAGDATRIGALFTIISNYVTNGLTTGAPTITVTTITSGTTFTTGSAHGLVVGDVVIPQTTTNGLTSTVVGSGQIYYVVSTPLTTTFTLSASYGGSAISTFTSGTGLSISLQAINMPSLSWVDSTTVTALTTVSAAIASYQSSVVTYLNTNYSALVYNSTYAQRDVLKVTNAALYDMCLNSNFASITAGRAYNRTQDYKVLGYEKTATVASLNYLQTLIATTLAASTYTSQLAELSTAIYLTISLLQYGQNVTPEVNGTTSYNNDLGIIKGVEILRANIPFLASEMTAYLTNTYQWTVTSTSNSTNAFTTSSAHNLAINDAVKFSFSTITFTATASSGSNITVSSTAGLYAGMPVSFASNMGNVGTPGQGITAGTTYYVVTAASTTLTISTTNGGSALTVGTSSAQTNAGTAGGVFGGIAAGTTYYVASIPSTTSFTVTTTQGVNANTGAAVGSAVTLSTFTGWMKATYTYSIAGAQSDTTYFLNAIINDLQFTGNYRSLRYAQVLLNSVNGSQLSNMWLVRNACGIRNMTMTGLSGVLTNVNGYGTKRPTAGSYTSLDPGFGPNDTDAWVNNRSTYMQNCSLFGSGCVGAKIDGALHAGGNRSMVMNDYTTFLSDGIGVWCTGSNSLTELVSVFSYYGYAGYLAELGAKIRATNGNSSYGTYGVIAEGVDTYETPITATLNNRGNQAYITNTLTDGSNQVLRIEYQNAGNNYTNATYTISGAGYNAAATGDEFRDYGVFESRLIDKNDGYGYGGAGYLTAANASQVSSVGNIILAASDQQLSPAYVGMRVLVTAGTGAGQYAAILSYNNGSKVASIYKESFTNLTITATTNGTPSNVTVASTASLYATMPFYVGTTVGGLVAGTVYYVQAITNTTTFTVSATSGGTALTTAITTTTGQSVTLYAAGWDHAIPGKTTLDTLDLSTTYIIEPRITYSGPGYDKTARTLATSATWKTVTYGAGTFVAIPSATTTATSYSSNGTTWAGAGNIAGSATTWADVIYGGGQGATATAIVGGSGGIGCALQAVLGSGVTAGQVIAVNVLTGGSGYATAPSVIFTSASGIGATATAVVRAGAVVSVTINVSGSGYLTTPTVNARTDIITGFTISSWGFNYTSPPTVTVSGGGSSNQSTGTAVLTNGGVSSITVGNSGGSGYTSQPTVTILDSNAKFLAIPVTASGGSTKSAYQTVAGAVSAGAWTAGTNAIPNGTYASITYGLGYWVAVGGTATASRTLDGNTWSAAGTITTTSGSWSSITYGNGYFIAITTGDQLTAISSTSGSSWTTGGTLPASTTWTSIAYGNGRFVALAATGCVAYSINNGANWLSAPSAAGATTSILSSSYTWSKVAYGQGLFFAVAQGTSVCATSPDGVNWTVQAMPSSSNWNSVAFGNPSSTPIWVAVSITSGQIAASMRTGATAQSRAKVVANAISEIRMFEPGSGYPHGAVTATTTSTNVILTGDTTNLIDSQPVEFTGLDAYGLTTNTTYYVIGSTIVPNTSFKVSLTAGSSTPVTLTTGTGLAGTYIAGPILIQTDPNKTRTAGTRVRLGTGVLGNPSFSNRGTANTTATSNVAGDGYSDLYQTTSFVNVAGLFSAPSAGANVTFASLPSNYYKLVSVTNLVGTAGNYTATFQINPALTVQNAPAHNDAIVTRLKYSQVRLTGHDFLYIGTGNYTSTSYPNVNISTAVTANQTLATNGGRVFFTSTDQDGNFNVGNLFGVQQSTGTATLNASAFNLSGLQSLQLGTVAVGAGSAIINSFSTDPYFTANSDNVLPTQRAIKSYITAQIGGGQSSLNVNTLTSGVIYVANNTISTTTGVQIKVAAKMYFTGGVDGAAVALPYFMQK